MLQNNQAKTKSFWERPEGTTGMVAIGLGVVGLWFGGNAILGLFNTAVAIVGQAITLTILGAILFALIMILTNARFQTLISYGFKSVMRKITGAFVEIDPIGIMKSYIEDLRVKREVMNTSIAKLKGQMTICENQVSLNEKEYRKQMDVMKVANERGNQSAVTVASRQAMRMEEQNKETLLPILAQIRVHHQLLSKYWEVTGTVIDDLTNEVKARELQRKMMHESHSAMSMAKKILQGGTDQRELFDQAMEHVVNDYGMKMGDIENFINNSKSFVEGLDIQNGVYEEEAMRRLQAYEKNLDSIVLGSQKQQILEQATQDSTLNFGAPAAQQFDYSELLNKNSK